MKIVNKIYNLKSNNVNKKIVLISDIHYYHKKDLNYLNKVIDNIKALNPDYICITGDLMDLANIKDSNELIIWLSKLSNITKVMIVLGNHEFYIDKENKIYGLNNDLIKKIKHIRNVYLLDNENIELDDINFIGITLSKEHYFTDKKDSLFIDSYIKKSKYNILLIHSSMNINNIENVDLVLSGHTHGGIVPSFLRCIFKNNGIISPNRKLFPKNIYGNFKINDINYIVTSGITVLSHINKFHIFDKLFKKEIVLIDIKKNLND